MDIQTYLTRICQHCGLAEEDIIIAIDDSQDEQIAIQLDVPQDDVGLFIGNRGETLASIQRMMRIVFYDDFDGKHIVLNINDYREERQRQLEEKAVNAAEKVLDGGKPFKFNFLSSYERYIVHSVIGNNEQFSSLETTSEGQGRGRRLVIRATQAE